MGPRRQIAWLAMAALVAANFGYAAKLQSFDSPRVRMTYVEAKKALNAALGQLAFLTLAGEPMYEPSRITFLLSNGREQQQAVLVLKSLKAFAVQSETFEVLGQKPGRYSLVQMDGTPLQLAKFGKTHAGIAMFTSESAAGAFADSLLTLRMKSLASDIEATSLTSFIAKSKGWLATPDRPPMPDDARSFKLLAEEAFQRKDFAAALNAYGRALEKFPLWPEGHYNAALLAAEGENYDLAAHHMRRYLILSPNAKDASVARDKLLLWQLKANGES
jgi:tetratricopeptide (TPR) repeat protein